MCAVNTAEPFFKQYLLLLCNRMLCVLPHSPGVVYYYLNYNRTDISVFSCRLAHPKLPVAVLFILAPLCACRTDH